MHLRTLVRAFGARIALAVFLMPCDSQCSLALPPVTSCEKIGFVASV